MSASRKSKASKGGASSSTFKSKVKKRTEFGQFGGVVTIEDRENDKDFIEIPRRRSHHHGRKHQREGRGDDRSVADLIIQSALMGINGNERLELEDFGRKPDLWMVAFDNPVDFIQYCRKRMDHEKGLLEKSRRTENDIVNLIQRWTESTEKHAGVLEDLCKVQNHNDRLQGVIMEERTNCQHLVGENYQLETERKMLSRKYQAALMLGKVNDKSVKHLLESNPKAVPLTDRLSDLEEKIKKCGGDMKVKGGGDCADPYVLAEKVERLESYIKSLKKQHHEEVTVLKDTIANYDLKYDTLKQHYRDALQRNSQAFEEVREVLAFSVNENLELREELLKRDDKFLQIQLDGIQKLTCKRHSRHGTAARHTSSNHNPQNVDEFEEFDSAEEALETDGKTERELKLKLSRMEIEVEEKSGLLKDILNKLMVLERTCGRLKEENAALKTSHQHSLNALRERNQVLQKRCEKTDERRKLDNVGFREDIRELRFLIKTLDKNVTKCIRTYGELETATPSQDVVEDDFEAIIDAQKSFNRYKAWLKRTDSKLVQKAMTSWTDFLGKKLDNLEEVIYSRKVTNEK